jgi:acetoin utilization protein AcuB
MLVGKAMTRHVTCALATDRLDTVDEVMQALRVRHAPVVEDGRLIGIVSDRDLLLHATTDDDGRLRFPEGLTVASVMRAAVVTCRETTTVAEAAGTMLELKIDSLPVTDRRGHLIGLLTTSDVLRLVRDRDDSLLDRDSAADLSGRVDWDVPEGLI